MSLNWEIAPGEPKRPLGEQIQRATGLKEEWLTRGMVKTVWRLKHGCIRKRGRTEMQKVRLKKLN